MNIATEFCFVTIVKHWINAYKNCVHMNATFKRVELESPGCSGFEASHETKQSVRLSTVIYDAMVMPCYGYTIARTIFAIPRRHEFDIKRAVLGESNKS